MKINTLTHRSHRRPPQAGFTLVELLMVLVILGILAGIVVPKVTGTGERARTTAAQTQLKSFETALNMFEVDTGSYPKGKDGLQALIKAPRDAQNWHGPYLESVPMDPWQHPYIYEFPGKHKPSGPDISSMGPNGRAGDEDDIVNWEVTRR